MPVVKFASGTVMTTLSPWSASDRSLVVPSIDMPAGPDATKPTWLSLAADNVARAIALTLTMPHVAAAIHKCLRDCILVSRRGAFRVRCGCEAIA